jgi:hypothetical protein
VLAFTAAVALVAAPPARAVSPDARAAPEVAADHAHPTDADAGPWLDRVKARLADDDAEGAARLLHWLSSTAAVGDSPAVDVVRALGGSVTAALRLVVGGYSAPGVGEWLRVAAARGVARPYPVLGAVIALPLVGPTPSGQASRLVAAEGALGRRRRVRRRPGARRRHRRAGVGLHDVPDALAAALPAARDGPGRGAPRQAADENWAVGRRPRGG